jgi:MDMPI C-terminal domain
VTVAVTTHDPDRHFVLDTGGVSLTPTPAGASADATLDLPAEAFLRLVYGRLDDAHVKGDEIHMSAITLGDLRGVFTGL